MPSLGADMVAGRLVEWRVAPGSAVRRGDVVAEVETDKGAIEVEIFEDGVVERLLVEPGARVPVGTPLALIRGEREAVGAPAPAAASQPAPAATVPGPAVARRVPAAGGPRRVSPLARKTAEAMAVDLATVTGTGAGGAITAADVEAAARRPAAAPMRRAIAAAMARSKREVPHYYLLKEIEIGRTIAWLEARNAAVPVAERMLVAAPLLKAVALALRDEPGFNGFYRGAAFDPGEAVHLGVAIRLRGGGLVAPAIHHADRLSVAELMAAMHDLIRRARRGSLRSSEVADPTVTVTSMGEQGVDAVFGVIFPPQVAILGLGRIRQAPALEPAAAPRLVLTVTLAADHRVSDGYEGARLLNALERRLGEPEAL